jgi:hypothetical protein
MHIDRLWKWPWIGAAYLRLMSRVGNSLARAAVGMHRARAREMPTEVISADFSADVFVLVLGEDECGAGYLGGGGVGGDVLEAGPAPGEQGEPAFATAAQVAQQRVPGSGPGSSSWLPEGLFTGTRMRIPAPASLAASTAPPPSECRRWPTSASSRYLTDTHGPCLMPRDLGTAGRKVHD